MEKLKAKYTLLCQALKTLEDALEYFAEVQFECPDDGLLYKGARASFTCDRVYLSARDSIIQRFEYCTDLFWKYLKLFLETGGKTSPSKLSKRFPTITFS